MLKIGIVGGAKKYHGMTFSQMLNGYDRENAVKLNWSAIRNAQAEGATAACIWDEDPADAKEVAEICNIPEIASHYEDMIGSVDGVIIVDDCSMQHQKKAIPFLKAGIPVFIDKPLSTDYKEAQAIVDCAAKSNALMMSTSVLRFAREAEAARKNPEKWYTGMSMCKESMGNFIFYGIHSLELMHSIIGPGIKSVRNVGRKGEDIIAVKWNNGRTFMVAASENIMGGFEITLFGKTASEFIKVVDFDYAYSTALNEFIKIIKTGKAPFAPTSTLEVIKAGCLAMKSLEDASQEYFLD